MVSTEFKPAEVIAIAFLTGFAIQQFLQILDWLIMPWIIRNKEIIWSMPAADFKKGLMFSLSFLCGFLVALVLGINLLDFVLVEPNIVQADANCVPCNPKKTEWLGVLISGLVLGSGTEAANTLIKYFGYLKDAQKYDIKPPPK